MRLLSLLIMALSVSAQACVPEDIEAATVLVLQANPMIKAERQELQEQSRQREWKSKATLGYNLGSAESDTAAGPVLGLQVEIPLFDRSKELKIARARTTFQQHQDSVLSDFMGQMERLCSKMGKVRELNTMRHFYRDRLRYRQERVKDGLDEADSLWKETEKAQKAEHDYRCESDELAAMRHAIARRFGGDEWKRLQDLLAVAGK